MNIVLSSKELDIFQIKSKHFVKEMKPKLSSRRMKTQEHKNILPLERNPTLIKQEKTPI